MGGVDQIDSLELVVGTKHIEDSFCRVKSDTVFLYVVNCGQENSERLSGPFYCDHSKGVLHCALCF